MKRAYRAPSKDSQDLVFTKFKNYDKRTFVHLIEQDPENDEPVDWGWYSDWAYALSERSQWERDLAKSGEGWRASLFEVGQRLSSEGETIALLMWFHSFSQGLTPRFVRDDAPWASWDLEE